MKNIISDIEFRKDGLYIGGTKKDLYSANFEFWRHNPLYWEKIIVEIKKLGFSTICTYLSWDFFKTDDGKFDFEGKTNDARNFIYFLDLCKKYNFDLILRPGPYIMAELETWGVPEEFAMCERLQPEFLDKAFEWLSAVNKIVIPYQKTKGGPIILYQADNEYIFPHSLYFDIVAPKKGSGGGISYQRDFIFKEFNLWFESIKDTGYGEMEETIKKIDKIICKKYFNFSSLSQEEIEIIFDFMDFCMIEYFKKYTKFTRSQGIEIPLIANVPTFLVHNNWRSLLNIVDSVGIDIYFPNLLPNNQYYALEWFTKLGKAVFSFPWSPEFQCGIWAGNEDLFGIITPKHNKFMNDSTIALGLRGYNFYTFVERDDFYYSPINPVGKVRKKNAEMYKEFGENVKNITSLDHKSDLGIIWDLNMHRNFLASKYQDWPMLFNFAYEYEKPREYIEWWNTFTFLIDKDFDFEIVDIRDISLCRKKALILIGDNEYYNKYHAEFRKYISNNGKIYHIDYQKKLLRKIYHNENKEKMKKYSNCSLKMLNQLLNEDIILSYVKVDSVKLRSLLYEEEKDLFYLFIINWSDKEVNYKVDFDKEIEPLLSSLFFADIRDLNVEESFYDFVKNEKNIDSKSVKIFKICNKV